MTDEPKCESYWIYEYILNYWLQEIILINRRHVLNLGLSFQCLKENIIGEDYSIVELQSDNISRFPSLSEGSPDDADKYAEVAFFNKYSTSVSKMCVSMKTQQFYF
jgi:hypothetical protein